MADFKIGDVVVCVDASARKNTERHLKAVSRLREGAMYRVLNLSPTNGLIISCPAAWAEDGFGWKSDRFCHLPKAYSNFTASMRALRPLKVEETNS